MHQTCNLAKLVRFRQGDLFKKWFQNDSHIDGNSDNNALVNLRLVCGNCDMQLPTYKSKNRGNGRHNRRKRYSEGKSF